jgi:hypothetical protein
MALKLRGVACHNVGTSRVKKLALPLTVFGVGAKSGFHGGRDFGEFPRQNSMIFEDVVALLELHRMGKKFVNCTSRF